MTAEIRKKIEEIQDQKQEIYVSAVAARARLQEMLKAHHMQRKGLIPKDRSSDPGITSHTTI